MSDSIRTADRVCYLIVKWFGFGSGSPSPPIKPCFPARRIHARRIRSNDTELRFRFNENCSRFRKYRVDAVAVASMKRSRPQANRIPNSICSGKRRSNQHQFATRIGYRDTKCEWERSFQNAGKKYQNFREQLADCPTGAAYIDGRTPKNRRRGVSRAGVFHCRTPRLETVCRQSLSDSLALYARNQAGNA